jgi:hypothetical protein
MNGDVSKVGTDQALELDDGDQDDAVMTKVKIKVVLQAPTWKRRKRKTKSYGDQGKCIKYVFILALKTP